MVKAAQVIFMTVLKPALWLVKGQLEANAYFQVIVGQAHQAVFITQIPIE